MQEVVDILISLIGWLLVVLTLRRLNRRERAPLFFWLFLLFFSIIFTLQINVVYLWIEEQLGVNNLTWFMSYVSTIIALAFLAEACSTVACRPLPYLRPFAWLTFVCVALIYTVGIRKLSVSLVRDDPRSLWEVLYIAILHFYDVIVLWFGCGAAFIKMIREEQLLPSRLRVSIFLGATVFGVLWQLLKLLRVLLIGLIGFSPALHTLTKTFPILLALVAVCVLLSFLPKPFYVRAAQLLERIGAASALIQSRWFAKRLESLWRPLALSSVPLLVQMRDPGLYLRRQIIYILDCRRSMRADSIRRGEPDARWAYHALQSLPVDEGYDVIVKACCQAGRRLLLDSLIHREEVR